MSNKTTKKRGIRLVNLVLIFILFFSLYCYGVSSAVKNEINYNYEKIINEIEIDDEVVEDTISSEAKDVIETLKEEVSERVLKVRTLKNVNKDIVRLA